MFLHFSCPHDRFEILWHQWQWTPFVFGWLWLLSSLRTWTMARRFSLTNIPKGSDYEKTRLLPLSVRRYFNDWTPEGPKGEFCAKDYVLVEVELTAIGYLQKAEAGVLLKYKPTNIVGQGTMKALEFDQNGNLLYKFAADAHRIVWVGEEAFLPMHRFLQWFQAGW